MALSCVVRPVGRIFRGQGRRSSFAVLGPRPAGSRELLAGPPPAMLSSRSCRGQPPPSHLWADLVIEKGVHSPHLQQGLLLALLTLETRSKAANR